MVNGVSFKLTDVAMGSSGLRGVVYTETLQKDLSQVQLAQNNQYRELVEALRRLGDELHT